MGEIKSESLSVTPTLKSATGNLPNLLPFNKLKLQVPKFPGDAIMGHSRWEFLECLSQNIWEALGQSRKGYFPGNWELATQDK